MYKLGVDNMYVEVPWWEDCSDAKDATHYLYSRTTKHLYGKTDPQCIYIEKNKDTYQDWNYIYGFRIIVAIFEIGQFLKIGSFLKICSFLK